MRVFLDSSAFVKRYVREEGSELVLSWCDQATELCLSGIALPASFEAFLEKLGGILVHTAQFADHHRFRLQEIIDFQNAATAQGAEIIVTTEKDAVRFPKLDRRDVQVCYLRVHIDILSGHEGFNECIARICFV